MKSSHTFSVADTEIPTEAEWFVVKRLFANSSFARFYAENRQRITMPVYWWPQPPSRSGYQLQQHQVPHHSESYLILLPNVPAKLQDAFGVAHELSHILLNLEGYPSISGNDFSRPTATILSSLFTDLVINRRLIEQYGFVVPFNGKAHLQKSIRNLRGKPLPTHPLLYAELLFDHATHIMQIEAIPGKNTKAPIYFWSKKHFPSLIHELDELMVIFHDMGWETPDQQEQLLRYLIERYKLGLFGLRVVTRKPRQEPQINRTLR